MQDDMLKEVINLIKSSNEIVVFSGAGISTNSGILDFRSSDGLYTLIEQNYDLPYPEAIFDIEYFVDDPGPFFDFTSTLLLQSASPTRCHEFIAWLEEQGKISLIVTQYIDMLHHLAGSTKVIECHGTFRTAHCINCDCEYSLEDIEQSIFDGMIPYCECGFEKNDYLARAGEAVLIQSQ
jgi:NAD-dependent SIR2 family protein deacetylase